MNRNLSWVDNKVFNQGAPQNTTRPYTDMAPTQSQPTQAAPGGTSPTGVSPATYQNQSTNPDETPQTAPMDVSPATYQDMAPGGLSPATYQRDPGQAGMMPSTGTMPSTGRMPSAGTAPGTGTGMPGIGMGMPGVLTRDVTYGPDPFNVQGPPTVLDPGYIPAYLRTQIGKRVRAEFNIGTNMYMDRTGILREVGISYFVLEDNVTRVRVMCDLYSLKFLSTEA